MAVESEEKWSSAYEKFWYVAYITRYDAHYWIVRLEGAGDDGRYRVFVHRSVVAGGFDGAAIGTKVKLRLRPSKKQGADIIWEGLECIVEPKNSAGMDRQENSNVNE